MREPCSLTSSQDPELVTREGLQAREGPFGSPARGRGCSRNSCLARHLGVPAGETPPVCDPCPERLRNRPRTQLCEVHTDCWPCQLGTGSRTCPRTPKPTSRGRSPSVEQPQACACGEAFAWRALRIPQERLQEMEEPRPCARCGKRFHTNQQQQTSKGRPTELNLPKPPRCEWKWVPEASARSPQHRREARRVQEGVERIHGNAGRQSSSALAPPHGNQKARARSRATVTQARWGQPRGFGPSAECNRAFQDTRYPPPTISRASVRAPLRQRVVDAGAG
ncbi:hypothetical protein H8959_005741 [Pygathrix nigripes]